MSLKKVLNNSERYGVTFLISLLILVFIKIISDFYPIWYRIDGLYADYFYSDIPVILAVLFFIVINISIKKRYHRIVLNFLLFIFVLYYYIDLLLIIYFQSRALIPEIFNFLYGGIPYIYLLYGAIAFFCFFILLFISFIISQKLEIQKKGLIIFFIGSLVIYLLFYWFHRGNPSFQGNIFTLNSLYRYSNGGYYKPECKTMFADNIVKETGNGLSPNIILVFLESFSAIDSKNSGGFDNLPLFDKIQNDGITYKNFIANGTSSSLAHISTILGMLPGRSIDYDNYNLFMEPLPKFLNSQGYNTTFISSSSLSFLNQRAFFREAGFKKIIGEEAFNSLEHYTFSAAPDEDVYNRILQETDNQTGKYFLCATTISFHKPYSTPYGRTEELALKYSEDTLFDFYSKLKDKGFFDNGILILASDHRMMNPIKDGEYELLGDARSEKIVAAVVGSGISSGIINNNIIQHTDIYHSIKKLVGTGEVELDKYYNNMFAGNKNRDRSVTVKGGSNATMNKYDIYFDDKRYYSLQTNELKGHVSQGISDEIYEYICSYLAFQDATDKNILKIH